MTDKELLDLAAKAAGYTVNKSPISGRMYISSGVSQWEEWSPLNDDAQALRLAVKLKLSVKHGTDIFDETNSISAFAYFGDVGECEFFPHGNDPYAATRRAIVRAAAEVAKAGESNETT